MVILFTSDLDFAQRVKTFTCRSLNGTQEMSSAARPVFTSKPLRNCKWALHIAVCPVTENLSTFLISKGSSNGSLTPFRHLVRKQYDVVTCISPLFMNENWQLLITSLELRRQYGMPLQVLYINSIRTELYEIVKAYQSSGFVTVEPWAYFDLGPDADIEYDPNHELDWRNQEAAHTDCFIKYKVSTRYIHVIDIDDVLVPRLAPTYFEEFNILNMNNASALIYNRYEIAINTSSDPRNFTIENLLNYSMIGNRTRDGKHVAITDHVLAVFLHWPSLYKNHWQTVDANHNFIFHFRKFYYDERQQESPSALKNGRLLQSAFVNASSSSTGTVQRIQEQFDSFMRMHHFERQFSALPNHSIYLPLIDACYYETFYKFYNKGDLSKIRKCSGPSRCKIPQMHGIRCLVAKSQNTKHHQLSNAQITVHFAESKMLVEQANGCSLS